MLAIIVYAYMFFENNDILKVISLLTGSKDEMDTELHGRVMSGSEVKRRKLKSNSGVADPPNESEGSSRGEGLIAINSVTEVNHICSASSTDTFKFIKYITLCKLSGG